MGETGENQMYAKQKSTSGLILLCEANNNNHNNVGADYVDDNES